MATHTFYNRFSFLYPVVDFFLQPQKRVLANEINKLTTGELLEVGVGNGSHLKFYKKHQITGIDISSAMLATAKKINARDITLLEMDGEKLSFEAQKFDYIVMSHVIAVAAHPDQLVAEAARVLKPNGKLLILNHFTPNNWLKYFDYLFRAFSRLFHFKSVFEIKDLAMENFALEKELALGRFHYFKLLIYTKN
jgi:phosphatidylethanolamine/phosphatidyl-N-methylethanolamine N-methyltransferase